MRQPTIWDFKKHGAVLSGVKVGQLPNIGRFGNTLYLIKDKAGKTWAIWGSYQIKCVLQMLPDGKKIRIEFKGKKKKKGGWFNDFKINVGKGADLSLTRKPKNTKAAKRKKSGRTKGLAVRRRHYG